MSPSLIKRVWLKERMKKESNTQVYKECCMSDFLGWRDA
jgi:hypothetical protein